MSNRNFGETGKYYSIFTRDLGMINASAQGVRKMSSKLRFVLQDFSYIKVDLVQGRDFWRITSASKTNELEDLIRNQNTYAIFYNIASLLKRLLTGVEPNKMLFSDLVHGLSVLEDIARQKHTNMEEELNNAEIIIVLRILNNLGYIGGSEKLSKLVKSPFEKDLIFEVSSSRREILKHINQALRETDL